MARKSAALAAEHDRIEKDLGLEPGVVANAQYPRPCLCGCGGFPKGANTRFLPGHDARYHAALKRQAAEAEAAK